MFLGHFGAGLGLKKAAPPVSLGLLILAAQFLDLLWPTLVLLDVEHVSITTDASAPIPLVFTYYPWSHSLSMALAWSALFALLYLLFEKNRRNALVLALAVLSHWLLDFIVHLPDLPLYPGSSTKLGLELWTSQALTFALESVLFLAGLFLYLRTTKAKNRTGIVVFWVLIALLVITHIANLFSPPPPSADAVAWAGEAMWLFVLLGFWADSNRVVRE